MKSLEAVITEALEESRAIAPIVPLAPVVIEVALRVREWMSERSDRLVAGAS